MTEKTLPVVLEAVNVHAGLSGLYRPSRATVTNRNVNISHVRTVEAVVGKNLKILFFGIQFEDTRALSATQLYSLGSDDLENAIQFQGGSNDRGHAVNCGQFMHLAAELFIGL